MLLIYLDTSNIDLLSKLRQQDRSRFATFLSKWRGSNCTLALSGTHLFELRRYGDAGARESRYQLLEELYPIRCQTDSIDNMELLLALRRHGDQLGIASTAQAAEPFPLRLDTPAEVSELRQFENEELALFFEAFYDASKVGAAASSREEGTKYERRRLSQIGDAKPTEEQRAAFLKAQKETQVSPSDLENLNKLVPREVMEGLSNLFSDIGLRFLDRAEEVGGANALAEALGVDPSDRATARSFTDQLSQKFTFRFSVREAARSLGIQDETLLTTASEIVILEECPGTWLRNAVEIEMRKATAKDVPSNLLDLNHLGHLPYVDLLFTDKRVADFARRVLTSPGVPASLDGVRQPVAVPNSIDALESAIFS
jgi:hypothetical protein